MRVGGVADVAEDERLEEALRCELALVGDADAPRADRRSRDRLPGRATVVARDERLRERETEDVTLLVGGDVVEVRRRFGERSKAVVGRPRVEAAARAEPHHRAARGHADERLRRRFGSAERSERRFGLVNGPGGADEEKAIAAPLDGDQVVGGDGARDLGLACADASAGADLLLACRARIGRARRREPALSAARGEQTPAAVEHRDRERAAGRRRVIRPPRRRDERHGRKVERRGLDRAFLGRRARAGAGRRGQRQEAPERPRAHRA